MTFLITQINLGMAAPIKIQHDAKSLKIKAHKLGIKHIDALVHEPDQGSGDESRMVLKARGVRQ